MSKELFLFKNGSTNYAITPGLFKKTFQGIDFEPTLCKRSKIRFEENFAKNPLTILFSKSNDFAQLLLEDMPEEAVTLIIYRLQNEEYIPYWQGRVVGARKNNFSIELSCDSLYSTLSRAGESEKITILCRHILYGKECGVQQDLWRVDYNVTATSSEIFISGLIQPEGYFNKGIAVMQGQKRRIIKQTATHIHLSSSFTGALQGQISLYKGCALTEAACIEFNNLPRHGGWKNLPKKNPFGKTGLL